MTFIELNRTYAWAINEDDDVALAGIFDKIVTIGPKALTRKRYRWNWLRGRSFYAALARWVAGRVRTLEAHPEVEEQIKAVDQAMELIHRLALQDGRSLTFRSFVWNLTKKVPIITQDTIPHLSVERLHNILTTKRVVYTDDVTKPLVDEVMSLRSQLMKLEEVNHVKEEQG